MLEDYRKLEELLEVERDICDRIEEQINDLSDLHQNEMTNIKQVTVLHTCREVDTSEQIADQYGAPWWFVDHWFLFSLHVESAIYCPSCSTICIFVITNHNRSFKYASPYLWNQLPSSFRQPHPVHCPPGSSSCRCIITVSVFILTIHDSLSLSLQTYLKPFVPQILSSAVFWLPRELPFTEMDSNRFSWSLASL